MDEELRAELLARRDEDQRVRQIQWPRGQYREIPDEIREMMRVDQANTAWLTHLDERRASVGLPPFAEYEAVMRRAET